MVVELKLATALILAGAAAQLVRVLRGASLASEGHSFPARHVSACDGAEAVLAEDGYPHV